MAEDVAMAIAGTGMEAVDMADDIPLMESLGVDDLATLSDTVDMAALENGVCTGSACRRRESPITVIGLNFIVWADDTDNPCGAAVGNNPVALGRICEAS